jgi:hypothetical protein
MERELDATVTIREGNNRRQISKREAMVKQIINKAVSGDHRAIQLLAAFLQKIETRWETENAEVGGLDEDDVAVVEGILERLKTTIGPGGGADDGGDKTERDSGRV